MQDSLVVEVEGLSVLVVREGDGYFARGFRPRVTRIGGDLLAARTKEPSVEVRLTACATPEEAATLACAEARSAL